MEDLTKHYKDLTVIKVDIKNWNSPVAKQFNLRSIPAFVVYGTNGKVRHTGAEAVSYIDRLIKKKQKS